MTSEDQIIDPKEPKAGCSSDYREPEPESQQSSECNVSNLHFFAAHFYNINVRLSYFNTLQYRLQINDVFTSFLVQSFRKKLCSIVMSGENLHRSVRQSVSHSVNSGGCTN